MQASFEAVHKFWTSSEDKLSILAYCLASMFMTLANKYLLVKFPFTLGFFVLAIQSIATIILLLVLRGFNLIEYRPLSSRTFQTWVPVTLLFSAMLYTGALSLQFLSIPLFTVFKNLTIIAIAYGEFLIFGSKVTRLMLVSFALIVVSSICAAVYDIEFDMIGFFWMFLNCFASAGFVLYLRRAIKAVDFKDLDTVYHNNLLSTLIFVPFSFVFDQWSEYQKFSETNEDAWEQMKVLIIAALLSGFTSLAISYASAWCVRVTSSTTYSMVGALNKLPIAFAGMFFFGNVITLGGVMSLILGVGSGVVYAKAKIGQQQQQQQPSILPQTVDDKTDQPKP